MQKKIISLALAGVMVSPLAFAEDAPPADPLSFNVGVVSDYLFRGVSQTRHAPAIQGGVDYAFSNGAYVGAWASSITWVKDWLGKGSLEVDVYGGYKNTFAPGGDWGYDVGVITYNYPGAGSSTKGSATAFGQLASPNTTEVYGALSYKWLSVKYSQAISSNFIGWVPTSNAAGGYDTTKNTKGSNYLELNAAYDLGGGWGISGHIGHQKVKNVLDATATALGSRDADYSDWNIGVTKDVGFGVIGLTYSATDAKGTCSNPPSGADISAYCWGANMNTATPSGFKDVAKGTALLSFKKTF